MTKETIFYKTHFPRLFSTRLGSQEKSTAKEIAVEINNILINKNAVIDSYKFDGNNFIICYTSKGKFEFALGVRDSILREIVPELYKLTRSIK